MCGIVGYVGPKEALPLLMNGLKRLEYRGYDSAGVALQRDGFLEVRRAEGIPLHPEVVQYLRDTCGELAVPCRV